MRKSSVATVAMSHGVTGLKTGSVCGDANSELGRSESSCGLALLSKEASGHQAPAAEQVAAVWLASVEKQMEQQWTNLQFGKVQPAKEL